MKKTFTILLAISLFIICINIFGQEKNDVNINKQKMKAGQMFKNKSPDGPKAIKTSTGNKWNKANNWSPNGVPSANDDVIINSHMSVNIAGVCNSLTINSGDTLIIAANQSLSVLKDFINNGTFTPRTGTSVNLNGTTAQIIGGSTPSTFYDLTINNSTGITLGYNVIIKNILTLTSGNLTLGAFNLTINPNGNISGGSESSYVGTNGAGQLRRTVVNDNAYISYPVGNSAYNPMNIQLTSASLTNIFGVNVKDVITNPGPDPTKTVAREWNITKSTGRPCQATIQFQFNDGEGLTDFGTGQVGHWNGNTYDEIAADISGSGPYVIQNLQYITSFSPFIVGNAVPMPVELASFTANVISRDVKLNWTTATETNNAGFEIQRSQIENGNWTKAGYVTGNGTKTTLTNYIFEDKKLNIGIYNYRLKQIDYNGNFEFHNLVNTVEVGAPNKFDISQNYPNPFNPTTKIDFDLPYDSKVSIKLYDMSGREVMTLVNETKTAGYYTVLMNGSNLSSGIYFYRFIAEGNGQNFVSAKKLILIK